jgi:hypothetical protein
VHIHSGAQGVVGIINSGKNGSAGAEGDSRVESRLPSCGAFRFFMAGRSLDQHGVNTCGGQRLPIVEFKGRGGVRPTPLLCRVFSTRWLSFLQTARGAIASAGGRAQIARFRAAAERAALGAIDRAAGIPSAMLCAASAPTISLAFLAPTLVNAAVEGRLPRGIGVTRLRDTPAECGSTDIPRH